MSGLQFLSKTMMLGVILLSSPLLAHGEKSEAKYTIRYADIQPAENGKVRFMLKERKVNLSQLLKELSSDDKEIRFDAIRAAEWPDAWPKEDKAALIEAIGQRLKDAYPPVQFRAVEVMDRLGPECVSALPQLMDVIKDSDALIRAWAVHAVMQIGPKAKAAIPVLIDRLADEHDVTAGRASVALGNIGVDALPGLMKALASENSQIREYAAEAFAVMGPSAAKALPELQKLSLDKSQRVRRAAAIAIVEIEDKPGRQKTIFFPGKIDSPKK